MALHLGQFISAKSEKEVYPSLSILQGETLLFQQRPLRIGIKSAMGKMHDICDTQPKLWRRWDKLGNLLLSMARLGCHPVSKGILTRFIVEMNYCIDEPKV